MVQRVIASDLKVDKIMSQTVTVIRKQLSPDNNQQQQQKKI
jgi:hypothetical protein